MKISLKLFLIVLLLESLLGCANGAFNSTGSNGSFFYAYLFNGVNSLANINSASFTLPTTATIEFYVKVSDASTTPTFVNLKFGAFVIAEMHMIPAGNIYLTTPNSCAGATGAFGTPGLYNDNQWHHVAGVMSGVLGYIFIDGVQVASGGITGVSCNIDTVNIGQKATNVLNGTMDEVRISNTVRYVSSYTKPTSAYTVDPNTLVLLHLNDLSTLDYVVVGGLWSVVNVSLTSSVYP